MKYNNKIIKIYKEMLQLNQQNNLLKEWALKVFKLFYNKLDLDNNKWDED